MNGWLAAVVAAAVIALATWIFPACAPRVCRCECAAGPVASMMIPEPPIVQGWDGDTWRGSATGCFEEDDYGDLMIVDCPPDVFCLDGPCRLYNPGVSCNGEPCDWSDVELKAPTRNENTDVLDSAVDEAETRTDEDCSPNIVGNTGRVDIVCDMGAE